MYDPKHEQPHWFPVLMDEYWVQGLPQDCGLIHFWSRPMVLLGGLDRLLPDLPKGRAYLEACGYPVWVRNSGGLAVVSGPGIINVTVIQPWHGTSIHEGFDQFRDILVAALGRSDIRTGTIQHSYCPGDYDLSIHDRKFAGLAQRRNQHHVSASAYLAYANNQLADAEMIRMFYELSGAQKDAKQRFPKVDPACMGSLQELTHVSWSEAQIINNVLDTMKVRDNMCFVSQADMTDLNLYNKVLSLMKKRNM